MTNTWNARTVGRSLTPERSAPDIAPVRPDMVAIDTPAGPANRTDDRPLTTSDGVSGSSRLDGVIMPMCASMCVPNIPSTVSPHATSMPMIRVS